MNILYINDLITLFCYQLNCKDLINFGAISKYHNYFVKKNKWKNLTIKLRSEKYLLSLINNYSFVNLDLWNTNVTDTSVSLLTNLRILDLGFTRVTDTSVSLLTKLHTLNLGYTNVTDASVSLLTNLHTLNLRYTKVTDASVSLLTNLHTLNLWNTKITDKCKDFLKFNNVIVS